MKHSNRRTILKTAGSAALLTAARAVVPGGAWAAGRRCAGKPPRPLLGFIALTDSSPLIIAKEKGFFAKYGMADVKLAKQASLGHHPR